jgi:hypothetical protein
MIFRSCEHALCLPRKRRALSNWKMSSRPANVLVQAKVFEAAGRRSFAPFPVRDHHRAG